MIIILLPACNMFKSDTDKIKDRAQCFVTAYNAGDIDGIIDCLDSKTRITLKSALGLSNAILGNLIDIDVSLQDIFGVGIGLTEDDMMTDFELNEVIINSDTATAEVSFVYSDEFNSGEKKNEKGIFYFKKENNDWYISDLKEN